jgi:hypothetical protein
MINLPFRISQKMHYISKLSLFTFLTALVIFGFSCKPKLNVNAPFKEIPVVFGLLNVNDTIHYIKITKAFIGDMDAYEMAAIRDSSEYPEGILDVKMVEKNHPQNLNRTFNLERKLITNKEPGIFYGPDQILYAFSTTDIPLHPNAIYDLEITNKETGLVVSSSTEMVHNFKLKNPDEDRLQRTVSFANINGISAYTLIWDGAKNGRRYNLRMVFTYLEINKNTGEVARKEVVFPFEVKGVSQEFQYPITGELFYQKISEAVPEAPAHIVRYVHGLDFYFDVAGIELNTYMEINEPVSGILQDKPQYTNIANGLGVFSSRINKVVKNRVMNSLTVSEFKNNPLFRNRNFTRYWNGNNPNDPDNVEYICIDFFPGIICD